MTATTAHTQLRAALVVRRTSSWRSSAAASGAITWVARSGGTTRWRRPAVTAVAGLRSAAANASPSANRSPGSFASARRTTAARSAGTDGGRSGTGSRRWARAVATAVSATKGRRPGQALERHDAERVDVGGGGRGPALGLLGGEVLRGAHHLAGAGQPDALGRAGDAEVGDLDLPVGRDEQVGRLHVAVHDAVACAAPRASAAWASRSRTAVGSMGTPGAQHRRQRLAVDQLHHQVGPARAGAVGQVAPRRRRRPWRCWGGAGTPRAGPRPRSARGRSGRRRTRS